MTQARKNYHNIPYRLLSYADIWIFLNLTLAIAISVPSWNYYTHGTHITVAHAMGATIGINTMLLFASLFYIIQNENRAAIEKKKLHINWGILITNISLLLFWISLLGSGLLKLSGKLNNEVFASIMQKSQPWFKLFAYSGIAIFAGLFLLIFSVYKILASSTQKKPTVEEELVTIQAPRHVAEERN